jgi:hypothetical protein
MSNIDFIINNNIDVFKADILKDFTYNLLGEVTKTYLGEKYINGDRIKEHFIYCFNVTIKKFNECGINIYFSFSLYSYFFDFFEQYFYSVKKNESLISDIEKRLYFLNIHKINTQKDKDNFMELYKLFY